MFYKRIATIGTLAALCSIMGCGDDRFAVYPVSGVVTYNGAPMMGGGSIAFVSMGDQKGKNAGGEIDELGNYTLYTNSPGDGSMAGEFRVVITQVVEEEPESTPDGTTPPPPRPPVPLEKRIPAKYSDFQKSPLKAVVKKEKNELNFDLKPEATGSVPEPATSSGGI